MENHKQDGHLSKKVEDHYVSKTLEDIKEAFMKLGLSKNEARVYLFLARTRAKKASEISRTLSLNRTETYRILRNLEERGLISSTFESPLKFIAVPFEKALHMLIETKKLRIKILEQEKEKLVESWLSIPQLEVEVDEKDVFQILRGYEQFYFKSKEIISRTKREIYVFAAGTDLGRLYYSELIEELKDITEKGRKVKLIVKDSPKSRFLVEKMNKQLYNNFKYLFTKTSEVPFFLISDRDKLLLILRRSKSTDRSPVHKTKRTEPTMLYTNSQVLVKSLYRLFFELWNSHLRKHKTETEMVVRSELIEINTEF